MLAEDKLKITIYALEEFGISREIIEDMLSNLEIALAESYKKALTEALDKLNNI